MTNFADYLFSHFDLITLFFMLILCGLSLVSYLLAAISPLFMKRPRDFNEEEVQRLRGDHALKTMFIMGLGALFSGAVAFSLAGSEWQRAMKFPLLIVSAGLVITFVVVQVIHSFTGIRRELLRSRELRRQIDLSQSKR